MEIISKPLPLRGGVGVGLCELSVSGVLIGHWPNPTPPPSPEGEGL
jgi:hypothetical protein